MVIKPNTTPSWTNVLPVHQLQLNVQQDELLMDALLLLVMVLMLILIVVRRLVMAMTNDE
jgi:hypothetical protein